MSKNKIIIKDEDLLKSQVDIKSIIYEIRGQKVMLDSDLATIYGYSVKDLNRQVKNNINKFPIDFMFQLTKDELDYVRCKFCTSPNSTLFKGQDGGRRYLPYVFSEQGIYMLATVLKGDLATKQSIYIIRTFKELRRMYIDNNTLLNRIVNNEINLIEYKNDTDLKFNEIFKYIRNHKEKMKKYSIKAKSIMP